MTFSAVDSTALPPTPELQVQSTSTADGTLYVTTLLDSGGKPVAMSTQMVSSASSAGVFSSITGNDASLDIAGQGAAQGGAIVVTGGASTTSANTGGAVSLVGGAGGATGIGGAVSMTGAAGQGGAVGGAATVTAGAGQGTGAGAIAGLVGGASGGGATGNGGVARVIGGAAASTAGDGGAAQLTGGAGKGTGVGGAATVVGGLGGLTNATGGAASLTGGQAQGTGSGATASVVGGASGAGGATGNGGAALVTGGASVATNGAGGNVTVAGGASTGTGAGSSITLTPGAVSTGAAGGVISRGLVVRSQPAPTALSGAATLTAAQLLTGILVSTTNAGAGVSYQMPTGTDLQTALPADFTTNDDSFDFYIINASTNAADIITLTVNTDVTIVGQATVQANNAATTSPSSHWRVRRTGAHVFVVYRLA